MASVPPMSSGEHGSLAPAHPGFEDRRPHAFEQLLRGQSDVERHVAMPATTDYWVNDAEREPLFMVTCEANKQLMTILPVVVDEVRSLIGDKRQLGQPDEIVEAERPPIVAPPKTCVRSGAPGTERPAARHRSALPRSAWRR